MTDTKSTGDSGEDLAAEFLRKKGYRILSRNWKSGKNEIDIIARDKDHIVFVEVKTRSAAYVDHPVNAVSREKQRTIILAADNYIKWNKIDLDSRFDIITIITDGSENVIDHIEDAFYPTLR